VARLALKDELLDAQLVRTAGSSPYGGSDLGECLAAASRVRGTDLDSWYLAWDELGRTLVTIGDSELEAGRSETARACFFRASSYLRTAGVMLMARPLDERLVRSNALQTETFRRGAALLDQPPDIAEIAFEHTTLPGYFFRARGDGVAATLILLGGYDGTAEELYFLNGAAALARGYNVLAFDGPGQGAALLQLGLVLRPDYEVVVAAVLDVLLRRPDTDPERVALIGLSLGAHLAPRAASGERRIAACIADCGSYDLFASAIERIPGPLRSGLDESGGLARRVLGRILNAVEAKPTAGWAIRRGQLVHGVDDPLAYLNALREYTLKDRAGAITCPMFVCNAAGDDISTSAPRLVEALTAEKEYVFFTAAEGAGDHCEAGARALYHARSFGWLDGVLHPER
jgi:pimeloyl-ACP methyl ester carboxylesterase